MMVYVIVERSYEEPIETEGLETRMEANPWCLEQYRVTYLRSFISTDGPRQPPARRRLRADLVRDHARTPALKHRRGLA
jgi:hypothetical protein